MATARRMLFVSVLALLLNAASVQFLGSPVLAQTLRVGVQADATTMDPHVHLIQPSVNLRSIVYEPLVSRDRQLQLAPALATDWSLVSPTTWVFRLRPNVTFHDGAPFTAVDVAFTLARAKDPLSQFRTFVATIEDVRLIDQATIEIATTTQDLLLPDKLAHILIMSRRWAEQNAAIRPHDLIRGGNTPTALSSNGTGPFVMRQRIPDSVTEFERNPNYWGEIDSNVRRVEWRPMANAATRVAALVSGSIDLLMDVPVQDVPWLSNEPDLKLKRTDEHRTILFGFDLHRDELRYGEPGIGNPFRDRRVREAIYRAIDIEAIQRSLMRGLATPTGQLLAPGNLGHDRDLDVRIPYDPAAARRLLAEAGYPRGFSFTLDCPNGRYVNDEAVCAALTAMLAKVGLTVTLNAVPVARYFPKLWQRDTSMFLMGLNSPYFDGIYALESLFMTPSGTEGAVNYGLYSNPGLDSMVRAARDQIDPRVREQLIRTLWRRVTEEIIYLPLYHQVLVWAMQRNIEAVVRPDNLLEPRWVRVN